MELSWQYQTGALARIGREPSLTLHLVKQHPCTKHREQVENFIRARFSEHYGARIQHFMPCLLALVDAANTLQGAVGLRSAASGSLFLERYLDRPIEEEIALRNGRVLNRNEIVEVGNLGALGTGHARLLIVAVTDFLVAQGFRWVTFTGTPTLLNSFQRLGLSPLSLGEANPARLGEEVGDWGSYYDSRPQVMAGDIMGGHQRLLSSGLYHRLGLEALYTEEGMQHVACA